LEYPILATKKYSLPQKERARDKEIDHIMTKVYQKAMEVTLQSFQWPKLE
jgi:hypothetical protein